LIELRLSRGSAAGSLASGRCGITVRRVLELLATYPDHAALLAEYPFLEPEDLQQALHYAAAAVDDERLNVDRVA
jgi:uncharacterized protein (DUF433 family)